MHDLIRFIRKNPEVAIGIAAFAGLAVGAGWVPLSIPSLGSLAPKAAPPAAAAAPAPPLDALSGY